MDELSRYVDSIDTFSSAQRHRAVGTEHYVTGKEAIEEDRFADVILLLEEAQTEFESANSLSRKGEENAPNSYLKTFFYSPVKPMTSEKWLIRCTPQLRRLKSPVDHC